MPQSIQIGNQSVTVQTGYCTNVHAGRDLDTVLQNLKQYSLPVRESVVDFRLQNGIAIPDQIAGRSIPAVDQTLGLGLWFSEKSVEEALAPENLNLLLQFLAENKIRPYTLNGFPQSDFHQPVVKHQVYLPTWFDSSRLEYTKKLVQLLDHLLPPGDIGSISTLPIGWGTPPLTENQIDLVTAHWRELSQTLHRLYESTGRTILIAVEPEPGCTFTDSASYRQFFNEQFLPRLSNENDREIARRYITICHDVCHAAVMYEDQASALKQFFDTGMRVGKVQVSSAVDVDWTQLSPEQREKAWEQLKNFVEVRYLHQVHIETKSADQSFNRIMLEDLPEAISKHQVAPSSGRWRVHFHVPIYLGSLDALNTTQSEITKTLDLLLPQAGTDNFPTGHFEVETYAWTVLPQHLHAPQLSSGIAKELHWFEKLLASYNSYEASIGLPC